MLAPVIKEAPLFEHNAGPRSHASRKKELNKARFFKQKHLFVLVL